MIWAEFGTLPSLRAVHGKSAFILAIPEPQKYEKIMAFMAIIMGLRCLGFRVFSDYFTKFVGLGIQFKVQSPKI